MELDYEKDTLKLMKLLAYNLKSSKYNNPDIKDLEEFFGTPWMEITLSDEQLKDAGIPRSFAKLLKPGVYDKQGMRITDFVTPEWYPDDMDEPVDDKPIMIHTLFWIEDIIKSIENKETIERKLLTKTFDKENSITFNELTGDFTYNNTKGKLSLGSRKFKLLHLLLKSETGSITYDDISRVFFNSEYNKANHSKPFSEALDDLKRELKILGEKLNPDCFENIPGSGYRLALP